MKRANCAAYQVGDEMKCPRCGLSWDANDMEPPACLVHSSTRLTPRPRSLPYHSIGAPKYASGLPDRYPKR